MRDFPAALSAPWRSWWVFYIDPTEKPRTGQWKTAGTISGSLTADEAIAKTVGRRFNEPFWAFALDKGEHGSFYDLHYPVEWAGLAPSETTIGPSGYATEKWFAAFVGSGEGRYVADALLAVVHAAEAADSKAPDADVHLSASLSSLTEALRRTLDATTDPHRQSVLADAVGRLYLPHDKVSVEGAGAAVDGAELAATRPTASDVLESLREEWDALGLMSYHGAPWSPHSVTTMYADLTQDDVKRLRELLRDAAATIEAYS